jgi:hypothetical protein
MWIVSLLILIALGILGIASWLKTQKPELAASLKPLEGVEGWVGVAGLVLGLWLLIAWIMALGVLAHAPVAMIIALGSALVMIALSLILAMPLLRSFLSGDASVKIGEVATKLAPFKVILGAICLGLALYSLIARFG